MSVRRRGLAAAAGAVLAVAGLLVMAGGASAAAPSTVDLRAAFKAADAGTDNQFLKDGPAPAAALERQWTTVRAWLGEWLRLHPAAPANAAALALTAAGGGPDEIGVTAERLEAQSLLIAVTRGSLGDAFILRRGADGRVTTAWTVEAPGAAQAAAFPAVDAWSPSRAGGSCREHHPRGEAQACGPLTATAGVLKPEASGARRFYLNGVYGQDMGATGGQLVTVWRWDGRAAQPLLARSFGFTVEQAQPLVAVDAAGLCVGAKGDWRQLFACGSCEGRQTTTEVLLPARGAAWGPTLSRTPEVDAVDALYDRIAHGRTAGDLAAPAVIAVVHAQVDAARAARTGDSKPSELLAMSMLSSWKVAADGPRRALCIDTDDLGPQVFTLARAASTWRVEAVRMAGDQACEGRGSHS